MYKETKRLEQAWQPQGTCTAISPPSKLARHWEQVTALSWQRLQKPLGGCCKAMGVVRPNKPSPFLVYLDGWEEGSRERPLRREWVQGETVEASNIYWAIPCISRLHILVYLILTTNFITIIIMPILYIGGKNPEVYRIVNSQPARVIHTIGGTGSLTQTRALDHSFQLMMEFSSWARPLSILPRKSTRTEVFFFK